MPSYSSERFYKDWRYAIEKDFIDPSGEEVKYGPDGFRTWGSELHRLPFPTVDCASPAVPYTVTVYVLGKEGEMRGDQSQKRHNSASHTPHF
jgi:hypothetical protein